MRVMIIGAGATGQSLAVTLCEMMHDVVLLDISQPALEAVESKVDILTYCGEGSSPVMLDEAGIDKTDMLLAVTNRDEVNILACMYAHAAGVATKVARVVNVDYIAPSKWNWKAVGIDLLVSQNEECAHEVQDILRYPGASDVVDMLGGKILSLGIRIEQDSPLLEHSLAELGGELEILSRARFIAVLRDDKLLIPHGDTALRVGDEAYVVTHLADADALLTWALPSRPRITRDIIAGGGGTGATLAKRMELDGHDVVLVEPDAERAEKVADELIRTLVLKGDASKQEILAECGIGPGASFTAATGDDELNIVSCVLAKKMGASWTVAHVGKSEYVPIIRHMKLLDRVVSPYSSMINVIMRFVRGRNVRAATAFQFLSAELLEMDLPGSSKWCGYSLRKLPLPDGAVVALVQRNGEVIIPGGDFVLQGGDRLAIFTELKCVDRVVAMFKK